MEFETNFIIKPKLTIDQRVSFINSISEELKMDIYFVFGNEQQEKIINLLINMVSEDESYNLYQNSFDGILVNDLLSLIFETESL
jgi:chemotaxis protein CheY-P-specific phosphatase CheC